MLLSYPLWCRSFFANEYHNGAEIILNSHFLTKKIYMLPHNKFVPIVSVFSSFFYFFQTLLITLIRLSSGTFAQKKSWFLYYSLHCKPKYLLYLIWQFHSSIFMTSKRKNWFRKTLNKLHNIKEKPFMRHILNKYWSVFIKREVHCRFILQQIFVVQCNLDLVTLNLATTCDLVTILQRPFFNLLHKIIRFSDIMRFSDSFWGDQKCH